MLTDIRIKSLEPREKAYKVADGDGLTLLVNPDGSRHWRFRYRYGGREKMISFGVYPGVSLKRAREKRRDARELLDHGTDPSAERQAQRQAQANSFKAIAEEWLKAASKPKSGALKPSTVKQYQHRLATYVYPSIGRWPIADVGAADLLKLLRRIEARDTHETAHRVRSLVGRVFRYAVASGIAERDPAADLRDALAPVKTRHFAALTDPKQVGGMLRAIDAYQGQPTVMAALRLAPLVFVRPGELRGARWDEFELDENEWRIPAERMKMDEQHIVPLSRQAVDILEALREYTGEGRFLFPSLLSKERPISDNTLNTALRRMGFSKEEMTAHGFRTMASTLLNELGYPPDVIELQLAHAERNKVRAAYNRAQRMAERREMMQAWADYLDGLKADERGKVAAIRA